MICLAMSVSATTIVNDDKIELTETESKWYDNLFGLFSVTGITGMGDVQHEDLIDFEFQLTIGEDCIQHSLTPVITTYDKSEVLVQFSPKVRDGNGLGYTQGTNINSKFADIDTKYISTSYCGERLRMGAIHQLNIGGYWEADPLNNAGEIDYPYGGTFTFTCEEEEPVEDGTSDGEDGTSDGEEPLGDADGDGVSNFMDVCPDTYGEGLDGCPEEDGTSDGEDGTSDGEDGTSDGEDEPIVDPIVVGGEEPGFWANFWNWIKDLFR